jgi:hypothetical protein
MLLDSRHPWKPEAGLRLLALSLRVGVLIHATEAKAGSEDALQQYQQSAREKETRRKHF